MIFNLVLQSFVPFAVRFFSRHPTKIRQLHQHWKDYSGRGAKLAALAGASINQAEGVLYELECEEPLFKEINGLTGMGMHPIVYYALVRLLQPDLIVETGVCDGFSSRFILLALERNGRGMLHSIDLPNQDVELDREGERQRDVLPNEKQTGWLVPESLKTRWQLHLGDARELLPKVLSDIGTPDMFIHDSLHTYDHMMFEFQTAWPFLKTSGILLSDDSDWNSAFLDFSQSVQCPTIMFNYRVGAIRKPSHPK